MAIKGRRGNQFDEHRDTLAEDDIRIPRNRFVGVQGLASDLNVDIPKQYTDNDLANVADDIGDAHGPAQDWHGRTVDFPISNLMAQHHVNRANARTVFESIKQSGYDRSNPIDVIADDEGYGVIFNGHHRALAARAAGMRTIPAVVTPFDEVYKRMPDDYK